VLDKVKNKKLGNTMKKSEIYKAAMKFFRQNTKHIDVIINDELEKIYFPMLPFCNNLTSNFRDQFNDCRYDKDMR
jgi:hypothetical protein